MKKLTFIALLFLCLPLWSQKVKNDTVHIKTSALCGDCKSRIEESLTYLKGVKYASLDLETKIATVIFVPTKTTIDAMREAISAAGYDADGVKAVPEAILRLPKCCQPNGH